MVIKNINLETVCGITSVLPENDKPEIAFAGKSNVGKSSSVSYTHLTLPTNSRV